MADLKRVYDALRAEAVLFEPDMLEKNGLRQKISGIMQLRADGYISTYPFKIALN